MRVVSLAPSCTEIIFALGCGEQLVGRTAFCDYPLEVLQVPAIGGWTTADISRVLELKPDLVLTSSFLQEPVVATLQKQGVTVCHTDPHSLADVLASFEEIAAALNVPERGRKLRQHLEVDLSSLRPTYFALRPRIYAEEWPSPPMASGNWVPDLLTLAGVDSFLPSGEISRTVTLEEIEEFDPDVILLNYCGMARMPAEKQIGLLKAREGWDHLRAVGKSRIVVIDDSLLNRPGPRLVEGARQVIAALSSVSVPVVS
jgi:iron complex transport system substrate-binding protein